MTGSQNEVTTQQLLKLPFFYDASKDDLEYLLEFLNVKKFEPNRYVYKEGDESKSIFFILDGSVKVKKKISAGEEELLAEIEAPQIIGEMAIISPERRSTSVISLTNLIVAELSCESFEELIHLRPKFTVSMIKKIANALNLKLKKQNIPYINIFY